MSAEGSKPRAADIALEILRPACTTVTFSGTFPEKIRAMANAGFTLTEVWMSDLFEHAEGPDVAVRIMKDHGVAPVALQALRNFEGCPREEFASKLRLATAYLDICASQGIPTLVLAANTSLGAEGGTQRLIDDLGALGDLAAERGVNVAFEPIAWASHLGTLQAAVPVLAALRHDHIGLQIDTFHVSQEAGGAQRVAGLGTDVPVFMVEVSDHFPMDFDVLTLSRAYRLFPGEGSSNLSDQAAALAHIGYTGPLVVEVFNAYYRTCDRDTVAGKAFRSLARFRQEVRPEDSESSTNT